MGSSSQSNAMGNGSLKMQLTPAKVPTVQLFMIPGSGALAHLLGPANGGNSQNSKVPQTFNGKSGKRNDYPIACMKKDKQSSIYLSNQDLDNAIQVDVNSVQFQSELNSGGFGINNFGKNHLKEMLNGTNFKKSQDQSEANSGKLQMGRIPRLVPIKRDESKNNYFDLRNL